MKEEKQNNKKKKKGRKNKTKERYEPAENSSEFTGHIVKVISLVRLAY